MNTNNELVLQDVFYHLTNLKTEFLKIKIEHNRNLLIVRAMDHCTMIIELIEEIIKSYDRENIKSLSNKINSVLLSDKELHIVNIIIQKNKFIHQLDKSKSALIIHSI